VYDVLQAPEELGLRMSREAFFKCFSVIDQDGNRVVARPTRYAPGWEESDCQAGPSSVTTDMMASSSTSERRRLQASDDPERRSFAFGREEMNDVDEPTLDEVARRNAGNIPITALAQGRSDLPGGHASTRRRSLSF
jgi:hypothetical protein